MKKVIDGLLYDTEQAEAIASYTNPRANRGDFRWYSEELYRTPNGRYFLAGHGNAQSKYASPAGDMTGPGEDIEPLTEREAVQWMEQTDQNPSRIIDEFPDHVETA